MSAGEVERLMELVANYGRASYRAGRRDAGAVDASDRAYDELRAALIAVVPGWREITDEHRNGMPWILTNGVAVGEAVYYQTAEMWFWAGSHPTDAHDGAVYGPTMCQPLPTPPPSPGGEGK
jgi:hypothetical protein